MTIYDVKAKQLLDNYACLQTLENASFEVGQDITVAGIGAPFSGTFQIYAVPEFLYIGVNEQGFPAYDYNIPRNNQVLYACTGTDVQLLPSGGTIEYGPVCTWIDDQDIMDWLGIPVASAGDEAFLIICADAANAFCYLRRAENNYFDQLGTAPSEAVRLGTVMYGGAIYRQRGSAGSDFATFDGMGTPATNGLSPMVKQLLGINRAVVA